jgi:hypothetical protein
MQTVTIILFTALICGFFFLFLAPGCWWPRRPPNDGHRDNTRPTEPDGDPPEPPRYTNSLN